MLLIFFVCGHGLGGGKVGGLGRFLLWILSSGNEPEWKGERKDGELPAMSSNFNFRPQSRGEI
jgi:hypothetical protein